MWLPTYACSKDNAVLSAGKLMSTKFYQKKTLKFNLL